MTNKHICGYCEEPIEDDEEVLEIEDSLYDPEVDDDEFFYAHKRCATNEEDLRDF